MPAPGPCPAAHPSRRCLEHVTDSLVASHSKSKVSCCRLNAMVYPWLELTRIGKRSCPASHSVSCTTIWPTTWHCVGLPRVSWAEDEGTKLPGLFWTGSWLLGRGSGGLFFLNLRFKVETEEDSGWRCSKWYGGNLGSKVWGGGRFRRCLPRTKG